MNYRLTLKEIEIKEIEAQQKLVETKWDIDILQSKHLIELKQLDDEFERTKQVKAIEV